MINEAIKKLVNNYFNKDKILEYAKTVFNAAQ